MDDPDCDNGGVTRRSPRFAVRKVAARMASHTSTEESAGATVSKKRKRQVDESKQGRRVNKKKQVIGFKCCPQMLYDLIQQLDDTQKKWVEELGFGCLLLMKEVRIPKILTLWLINQVDCKRKCLVIRGKRFKIKDWIFRALGTPKGDLKVPLPGSGRGKSKIRKPTEDEKEFRAADGGRGIKVKDIITALVAERDVIKFKKQFMLVLLCIYLAPTSGHFINRSYRAALVNIDQVKDMDWCEFIANYLVEGIREYLESPAANVNVHGCVHLLPLMYITIVRSQQLTVPNQEPLIQCVTTELMELLESLDMQHDNNGEPTFGNLEINPELECHDVSDSSDPDTPIKALKHIRHPPAKLKSRFKAREVAAMDDNSQTSRRNGNSPKRLKRVAKETDEFCTATTLDEIETQYNNEREKVYQLCFDMMRQRLGKLDTRRKSAMERLLSRQDQINKSDPNNTTSSCRVSDEAAKAVSADERPQQVPDRTGGSSLRSSSDAGSQRADGSPSAFRSNEVGVRTPGTLSENIDMVVDNPQQDPTSSDGHSNQQVSPVSEHVADAADGGSTEVCTSSDAPKDRVDVYKHIDSGNKISSEAGYFDVPKGLTMAPERTHASSHSGSDASDTRTEVVSTTSEEEAASTNHGDEDLEEVRQLAVEASSEAMTIAANEAAEECTRESNFQQETTEQTSVDDHTIPGQVVTNISGVNKHEMLSSTIQSTPGTAGSDETLSDILTPDTTVVVDRVDESHNISSTDASAAADTISSVPPTYTFEELEVNEPPQTPSPVVPSDIRNIIPLSTAIPEGQFFLKAGSVNTAVKSRPKRIQKNESKIDGIAACVKNPMKDKVAASRTYAEHVEKPSRLAAKEPTSAPSPVQANATKIRIRGFHISEQEFVQSLAPNGVVGHNFMWLCCVAIMEDWGSRTKFILNQTIVNELMKSQDMCNLEDLTRRLRELPLKGVEQLYIPVPYDSRWILIVVSLVGKTVEIYDSMRSLDKGDEPYKMLWATMGQNLQDTLSQAMGQETPVHDEFSIVCAQIHIQPSAADSGLEVIRALDCHNGKNLIVYGKKKMEAYRNQIAHTLVYHRFNDLNPLRKGSTDHQTEGTGLNFN